MDNGCGEAGGEAGIECFCGFVGCEEDAGFSASSAMFLLHDKTLM